MTRKSHGALLIFWDTFPPGELGAARKKTVAATQHGTRAFSHSSCGVVQPGAWLTPAPPCPRCTIRISHSQEKTAVRLRACHSRSLGFEAQRFLPSFAPYFGSVAGPRLSPLGRGRGDLSSRGRENPASRAVSL